MPHVKTVQSLARSQMKKAPLIIDDILMDIAPIEAITYVDANGGWTVQQVIGHLRDFEEIFVDRIQLTLKEEMPELPFPDPEELAAERDYNSLKLDDLTGELKALRTEHLGLLETIEEEQWLRPADHPTRGPFTILEQVQLTAWHDINHVEQMQRILRKKLSQA